MRGWDKTQAGQVTQGIFHSIWHQAQHIKLGEEEKRRDIFGVGVCLPKPPLIVMGPCFPVVAEHMPGKYFTTNFFRITTE